MSGSSPAPKPKIGAGHAQAMGRSGFKEIGQLFHLTPESVKPVEEPGLFGNPVAHEVFRERNPEELGPEPEMEMNFEM